MTTSSIANTTQALQLSEVAQSGLRDAISKLEPFLNTCNLPQLLAVDDSELAADFYRGLLSDLRHLLVYSEVTVEKLGILFRRPQFDEVFAHRILYDVYHQCVNAYFYPRNECYSEDGRYAYTGQDAIRFRFKPVREARLIVLALADIFENLRDQLAYYENDYLNDRRKQGQS